MAVTSLWAISETLRSCVKMRKAVVFSEGAAPDFIGPRLARFRFAPTLPVHILGLK
jgi:hypothetical protein